MRGDGPLLQVQDLVVKVRLRDQEATALDGIAFSIAQGLALGLVGESGCGKSLTALAIMGLLDGAQAFVAAGRVLLSGEDLLQLPEPALCQRRGRRLAMVFQNPAAALNPVMRVGAQIAEPLRLHLGLSRRVADARAVALLDEVGIAEADRRARAFPHELSGGMKQRALIAMALACDPALLLLDEPTTALDATVQAQVLELIRRQRHQRRMGLLFISHDLAVVARVCDEVAVMYAGHIVEQAPTTALLARPRHPYTRGLLDALAVHPAAADGARPRLREIPGAVPPLGTRPSGCGFAARCAHATSLCRSQAPPTITLSPAHLVRCHHPLPG